METQGNTPASPSERADLRTPPACLEGWYALHQKVRLDWPALMGLAVAERRAVLKSLASASKRWATSREPGWSGIYRTASGGIDLLILHFRDSVDRLLGARRELRVSTWGAFADVEEEYLSVVELGLYALTRDLAERVDPRDGEAWTRAVEEALQVERAKGYATRRLRPRQPEDMPYICFYPMDKRRDPGENWYELPLEERAALMAAHGKVGRRFAGRLVQVIGGSMGLDDWEWAVTLWAADPLTFKAILSEMRYDEASARYGEFGPFTVGKRMTPKDATDRLAAPLAER